MKKLFISTLGFEEAFLLRFLLRNQPQPGDVILIVLPLPEEPKFSEDPRSVKAYQEVERFLAKYMPEVVLEKVHVPITKIHQAVAIIAQKIKSLNITNAVVNLSGGMRALIVEVLVAVRMVLGDNADIEVELENKQGVVKFKPSIVDIKAPTSKQVRILNVMKELGRGVTLSRISNMTGIPRSSVYKELKKMEKEGFVARKNKYFTLTDLGFAWAQGERL